MNILSSLKKGFAALTMSALLFAFVPAVSAVTFSDSAEIPSWATEAIDELNAMGVISGNADGSFAPARQLNRAEVAKIIVLASGVDMDTYGGPHFPDVMEDAWYYDAIETMYAYGWVNGYPDGKFRPGNGINRAEIAKMVVNALELDMDTSGAPHFDDVMASDWFFDYVETAYNYDLMRGYADGTFGPTKAVTRAETAKIVYDGLLATTMPSGPAEGTLEVSVSTMTPRGTNVPYNATSVPYTTLELTASDDSDVEISSITMTRLGLGDNDDFNSVWMEIDGFKVGNDKSINNDDVVELRFNPPVVVPAGQTLVADIVASAKFTETTSTTDKNVGHHNRLAVVSASDVASTAMNVVGDFPLEGEEMEVADYKVSQIDFSNLGSDSTIDVGDNFIEIGKFRMLNESTSNKDIELRALTFKSDGTAELENVLENLALYVSGEQVSAESIIDGDYVTFRLDNGVTGGYILEDGDSRIFSMRADIISAEKGDTIEFKVDNYEDIVAIEIGTSFGVKTISTSYNAAGTTSGTGTCAANADAEDNCARLAVYAIDSGDINVSRDPSSLGNQQYAPGSNDVIAMTARVVVDQPLLSDGITLTATYGNTVTATLLDTMAEVNTSFSNFRLFLNDSLVDSENAVAEGNVPGVAGSDTAGRNVQIAYDTTFEVGGASILKLVMNVQDGAKTGSWIKFNLDAGDFKSPEYISTGDQIDTTQMLGSAAASRVEVTKSILEITVTDGFSSEVIVAGLDDVTMMEFVLDNNDSGDVNVTSLSIDAEGLGEAGVEQNFTAAVFVDGTQQGSSKNLDANGLATFNDLSVVIPSAGQKEFALVVNTLEASSNGGSVQIDTITIAPTTLDDSSVFIAVIDGVTFTSDDTAGTTSTAKAADLLAEITGHGSYSSFDYTAAAVGGVITLTGSATGVPFTVTSVSTTDTDATLTETIVHASNAADTLKISITGVDSDNVENGQEVVTYKGANLVAATTASGQAPVPGSLFTLVENGSLTVQAVSSVSSDILVAGADDVEVLKIQLSADDDAIQIKDLYFDNNAGGTTDFGPRADFKLYNEAGQLIQTKQMGTGDVLHFELANQSRITVPKDDSTYVYVKVDVREINDVAMSGKTLKLTLRSTTDTTTRGVEALTAATGTDIATPTVSPYWGAVVGEKFVAYRSKISVDRVTPSSTTLVNGSRQELFRFMVSADSAGSVKLDRIALQVTAPGVTLTAMEVEDAADSGKTYVYGGGVVDFNELLLSSGESKTFILYGTVAGAGANESVSVQLQEDVTQAGPLASTSSTLVGVAQVNTVTPGGTITNADVNTITINGTAFSYTATTAGGLTAAVVGDALIGLINAGSESVTASGLTTGTVILTSDITGGAFVETSAVAGTGTLLTVATTANTAGANIVWADESSNAADDFMNGYLIKPDKTATTKSVD